jgi:hypothetical protein
MAQEAQKLAFEAILEKGGEGDVWIFIQVPFDVHNTFGTKARVSVKGTINGYAYRNSIFPNGNSAHLLMINKNMQKHIKAAAGNAVTVVLEADNTPRTVEIHSDLKKALEQNKAAQAAFDKLSPSRRNEIAFYVEQAKRDETRSERIQKTISQLQNGKTLKDK